MRLYAYCVLNEVLMDLVFPHPLCEVLFFLLYMRLPSFLLSFLPSSSSSSSSSSTLRSLPACDAVVHSPRTRLGAWISGRWPCGAVVHSPRTRLGAWISGRWPCTFAYIKFFSRLRRGHLLQNCSEINF